MRGETWRVGNGEAKIVRACSVKKVLFPQVPLTPEAATDFQGVAHWGYAGIGEISTSIQYMPPNVIFFVRNI